MDSLRAGAKGAGALMALLLAAACLASALAYVRDERDLGLPYPLVRAATDPAALARGRYLVHGPAHCADCHASPQAKGLVEQGREAPLSGGRHLDIFLGRMWFPNITPDSATGIGTRSDAALARLFRHGVDHRGAIGLPFMPYADLADSDLAAILGYLRSLAPVGHAVPRSEYNLLGTVTRAYFLKPFAPSGVPPAAPAPGRTAEYGRYLVEAVAGCASCHTRRNMKTGEYTGPRFAGGMVFRDAADPTRVVVSPNLTPDSGTGILVDWDEAAFVRRFRDGSRGTWSPMPWGPFSRMTGDDLAAMYLYLRTLPPARHPGPG